MTGDDLLGELLDIVGRPRWYREARCLDFPDVVFFCERGQPAEPAKAICAGCPVREQCLDYALTHSIREGVWGGTSENERRALRRVEAARGDTHHSRRSRGQRAILSVTPGPQGPADG